MDNRQHDDEMWRDPNNWKFGVIYFNPNDKRTFVLKRNPIFGITLNFANPKSYLFLVIFVFLAVHFPVYPK